MQVTNFYSVITYQVVDVNESAAPRLSSSDRDGDKIDALDYSIKCISTFARLDFSHETLCGVVVRLFA
jgi:hypothetical protein